MQARCEQKAENQYVGVNCGIMDQFASACGVENNLLLLDCRSLEWKIIPLPEDVAIVIADTTVRRKLTSGEYNKRRAACEEAVRLLQQDLLDIKSLRDVNLEDSVIYHGNFQMMYRRERVTWWRRLKVETGSGLLGRGCQRSAN